MDSVLTTVETKVQDGILTAIESLVIPGVELAMKSVNASSGRCLGGNVLKTVKRDFPGNIEGLRMTASSRINSYTDLNKIDETSGNSTVEVGDLVINERKFDWQTHAHHNFSLL